MMGILKCLEFSRETKKEEMGILLYLIGRWKTSIALHFTHVL